MFCTQCGMENAANTDVCVACGTSLTPRQTNENLFGGYTADINEKLGRLHGINQRHFLNEAKETKGRIRNKLIVSGVIGVPLLAIWVLELIACAPELLSYLQGETVPEIAAGLMGLTSLLMLALLPLGISTATEYVRDHEEYKNAAIALIVISVLGLGIVTLPALAIAGIPGLFYLRNKRTKAIEEIKLFSPSNQAI